MCTSYKVMSYVVRNNLREKEKKQGETEREDHAKESANKTFVPEGGSSKQ